MNKLILCEGATDAILLSYYLEKIVGWKFCKKPPRDLQIKEDGIEESINWYEKGEDRLLICGTGGKDRIKSFFENKIKQSIINSDAFEKIALVLDRDDKSIENITAHASSVFSPYLISFKVLSSAIFLIYSLFTFKSNNLNSSVTSLTNLILVFLTNDEICDHDIVCPPYCDEHTCNAI